jgi:hypothetical protein
MSVVRRSTMGLGMASGMNSSKGARVRLELMARERRSQVGVATRRPLQACQVKRRLVVVFRDAVLRPNPTGRHARLWDPRANRSGGFPFE